MVIVGMLVLIRKEMDQNLGKIPGVSNINELQKIILQGMACILRSFLPSIVKFINNSYEVRPINGQYLSHMCTSVNHNTNQLG